MSKLRILLTFALSAVVVLALYAKQKQFLTAVDAAINHNGASLVDQGRQIFRFDTFGDQDYWGECSGSTKPLKERN